MSLYPLEKNLRNHLEHTVEEARETSEAAARAALEQLGVGEAAAYAYLSPEERELRRKLRIHGRQLGDQLDTGKKGLQELDRLVEEVAYEHWHRMLFARFLAENDLSCTPTPTNRWPSSWRNVPNWLGMRAPATAGSWRPVMRP